MVNIHEILKGYGIEVPADKKADFDKAVAEGILTAVLGTNLTYHMPELDERDWFFEVDCSKYTAYIIAAINHEMSVSSIIDPIKKIEALLDRHSK